MSDVVDQVKAGYAFDGPSLHVGALVVERRAAERGTSEKASATNDTDGAAVADAAVRMPLAMLNRHGLVAGATGTGKTKTLQLLAEQLSAAGVPAFLADIKGDLSGMATPGASDDKVQARAREVGQDWQSRACPVEFLALGGEGAGVPVRVTMTSFGPTLLSKVLGLNEVQESSLGLVFHYADKAGLPLLDLEDLRAVVSYLVSDEGKDALRDLGGLSKSTAGVILRELIAFADAGADAFFGEPEFDTADLLRTAPDGQGIVSILELPSLQDRPILFSTFLMWLLADLFDELPEVGDLDKPKLVFFFDEAHLLFTDASKDFLTAVTQTVRLIRSKGVGVFFVTQTPDDIPDDVLGQLGNRVQHALRVFTPADAKALRATVSTFPMSSYDLEEALPALGTGEAMVTVLSERGTPTPVAWTRMIAPQTLMAPAAPDVIARIVQSSALLADYGAEVDRESAYEMLAAKLAPPAAPVPAPTTDLPPAKPYEPLPSPVPPTAPLEDGGLGGLLKSPAAKAMATAAAATLGREIVRGMFGTARRRRRRRR